MANEGSALLLIEGGEELGQGSKGALVERREGTGVLDEVMPKGLPELLAFWGEQQRFDAPPRADA